MEIIDLFYYNWLVLLSDSALKLKLNRPYRYYYTRQDEGVHKRQKNCRVLLPTTIGSVRQDCFITVRCIIKLVEKFKINGTAEIFKDFIIRCFYFALMVLVVMDATILVVYLGQHLLVYRLFCIKHFIKSAVSREVKKSRPAFLAIILAHWLRDLEIQREFSLRRHPVQHDYDMSNVYWDDITGHF